MTDLTSAFLKFDPKILKVLFPTFSGEPGEAARDVQQDMQEANAGRPRPVRGRLHVVPVRGEGHLQREEGQERARLQDLPEDRRDRGGGRAAGQDAPKQHCQRRQLHRQVKGWRLGHYYYYNLKAVT